MIAKLDNYTKGAEKRNVQGLQLTSTISETGPTLIQAFLVHKQAHVEGVHLSEVFV